MNWKMCNEVLCDMKMSVKLKGRVQQNDGQTSNTIDKSAIGAVGNGLGRYAKLCQLLVAYVLSAAPVLTTGYFRQST